MGRPVKGPSKFLGRPTGVVYVGQNFVWVGQTRVWVGWVIARTASAYVELQFIFII